MMKLLRKLRNSKRGFSLVELIVVIAIMAVIAVILIPSLLRYVEDSRAEKDIKTTDELVTAVELALADQDIYDELVEHSVWDNVSCYVDKDSESGFEKTIIKETYNGNAEQYKFDDDARQNDEVPYYGAGNMRGLTITLSPTKDSNESTYELSRAIINRFVGRKTGYLYECEKLYNNVRSIVGDTIQNSSQTYRNSDFTIFIRLGSAGGNEAGNQDATEVWGQYNGTNLPADTVQTAKITTDRVVGDAGQYDKDVNDYINDETNTDIDFSKLAEMGGNNFGSTLDKEETLAAGLYDENDELVANWNDLVNTYGLKVDTDHAAYNKEGTMYYVLNNNPDLSAGKKLVIDESVKTLGNFAIMNVGLTDIYIPNGVTKLGKQTFARCANLTSIKIPDSVEDLGTAFYMCRNLVSVDIPKNLNIKTIGSAFYYCESLTSITIPDSVESIGASAFWYCKSLTSLEIPSNVSSIGNRAFSYCSNLEVIKVDENNSVYDSRNNCNAIIETATNTLIQGCKTTIIPDSIASLGHDAFYGANLDTITIPNGISEIGDLTFYDCLVLTSVVIPKSVKSIGKKAFNNCKSLISLEYNGTTEEWNSVNLYLEPENVYNNWNASCPKFTVHCTNGNVEIQANN